MNSARHLVAITRMTHDDETLEYVENRRAEVRTDKEIPLHEALPGSQYLPPTQRLSNSDKVGLTDIEESNLINSNDGPNCPPERCRVLFSSGNYLIGPSSLKLLYEKVHVRLTEKGDERRYLFVSQVPPSKFEQLRDCVSIKSVFEDFGGVASYDRVGWDVLRYDGLCGNDGTMTNCDSGKNRAALPKPNIILDDHITLGSRLLTLVVKREPVHAELPERPSGNPICPVVSARYDLYTAGNTAK